MFSDFRRNAIISLRDPSGNCRNGIAVTANRDGVSDCIFKSCRFEKCHHRLWYGVLAGLTKLIAVPYAIKCEVHRIVVLIDVITDLQHALPMQSHEDCDRRSLCAFDPFRMIMRHLSYGLGHHFCFIHAFRCKSYRRNTHCRSVPKTAVWLWIV